MKNSDLLVIDPLLTSVISGVLRGQKKCIDSALALFGSENDFVTLKNSVRELSATNPSKTIIVDMTPFPAVGSGKRMSSFLEMQKELPFLVAIRQGTAYKMLQDLLREDLGGLYLAIADEKTGEIYQETFALAQRSAISRTHRYMRTYESFTKFRLALVSDELQKSAKAVAIKPPPESRYIQLSDGTWANQWIDIKQLVSDPRMAFRIAYFLGYSLSDGYKNDLLEDVLVVGNNTAYILGTMLASILDRPKLLMVDRLGPLPELSTERLKTIGGIAKKRLCIIEDVLATGRELDMLYFLALTKDAEVIRAACAFDLEIAHPRFMSRSLIHSLCRPSRSLRYYRKPAYSL